MENIPAKTILSRQKSPSSWFGSEYNMNLYRGCSHGCLYCDSRSNCFHIENFDKVRIKENCLQILRNELAKKHITGVVATGAMSDPYNPFEKTELATRHALELLNAYGFGTAIATKSNLIIRDVDILRDIRQQSPVICKITITTGNDALASKIEPAAPSSSLRFSAIEKLSNANIFTGILLMPVLPFLEDNASNILGIVNRAAQVGARFIYPAFGVTMRDGQREYFLDGLESAFPGENLKQKYTNRFGLRYHCSSPRAKELWHLFQDACQKTGILYKMPEIIRAYRQGYSSTQLSFY